MKKCWQQRFDLLQEETRQRGNIKGFCGICYTLKILKYI